MERRRDERKREEVMSKKKKNKERAKVLLSPILLLRVFLHLDLYLFLLSLSPPFSVHLYIVSLSLSLSLSLCVSLVLARNASPAASPRGTPWRDRLPACCLNVCPLSCLPVDDDVCVSLSLPVSVCQTRTSTHPHARHSFRSFFSLKGQTAKKKKRAYPV